MSSGAFGSVSASRRVDVIDRCEVERADQFEDANIGLPLLENLLLMGLTAAAGRYVGDVVVGDNAGPHIRAAIEHVKVEARPTGPRTP